jgi:hypothetical protein
VCTILKRQIKKKTEWGITFGSFNMYNIAYVRQTLILFRSIPNHNTYDICAMISGFKKFWGSKFLGLIIIIIYY